MSSSPRREAFLQREFLQQERCLSGIETCGECAVCIFCEGKR